MRAPYLILSAKVLGSPLMLAGFLFPSLLFAQTKEQALHYKVGELARETVVATETIRFTPSGDHSDLYKEARMTTPPIYAYQKTATQRASQQLVTGWNEAKEKYLNSLERVFGKRTFRSTEIASDSFGQFIESYQSIHSGFPINDSVARQWAAGTSADNDLRRHITSLEEFMTSYFIRADDPSITAQEMAETIDLVSINKTRPSKLTELVGTSISKIALGQILSLSKAKEMYFKQSQSSDRTLNTYLSQLVQPNTLFLEAVSIERWRSTQSTFKGEIVFQKGDIIVRKGEKITRVIKEALDVMIVGLRFARLKDSVKIELAKEPRGTADEAIQVPKDTLERIPANPTPGPKTKERPQGKLPPILSPTTVAQSSPAKTERKTSPPGKANLQASAEAAVVTSKMPPGTMSSLARWMIGLVLMIVVGILVFLHFKTGPPIYIAEEEQLAVVEDRKQSLVKALTSHLTQTLFRQRQELLKSKENATAQVAAMENRLAKLQPEIFDKLAAYEEKIKQLEAQLQKQGVSKEMMSQGVNDDVARPIFDDLEGTAEGEENFSVKARSADQMEDDKEVPFPGHTVAEEFDDNEPSDLLEEVMDDLEVEDNFDKRIAKGSDR